MREIEDGEPERPPRVAPRIIAAPKVRQVYWCDFWSDVILPEMWKRRPVVVISFRNALHGPCSVVPCSTNPQEGRSAEWAHELSVSLDARKTWAVCNHLYTVSPSRLFPDKNGIPRLSEIEFDQILSRVLRWLPKPVGGAGD